MDDIVVSKEEVNKLLKCLNPSKALGSAELTAELGPVFAHLFQLSLVYVCPLCKKGDRSLAFNYRPVSLTCEHCELLEHIVCLYIMAHLDEYKLLSNRQHAFRKRHICETHLTTVMNDWAKILDNR